MTDDVHEHELHAYVDGGLAEARRIEVEAWLAAHPADAARAQAAGFMPPAFVTIFNCGCCLSDGIRLNRTGGKSVT